MYDNSFIKIINEEINKFDFLSNDEFLKEQEITDLLLNDDLQKQFICDSLLYKNNKIKIIKVVDSHISGNWDDNTEDANKLSFEYTITIEYKYDSNKEPLVFDLSFNSDKIDISVNGWNNDGGYQKEPEGDSWYDRFDWSDIDVFIYSKDGDEIGFNSFKNSPPKIQILFIMEYTQNFIESNSMEIRTPETTKEFSNIQYC